MNSCKFGVWDKTDGRCWFLFDFYLQVCESVWEWGDILIDVFYFFSLEEDRYDSYSRMILKYFLAEGVVCRHELFVSAAQESPDNILQVWPYIPRRLKTPHLLSPLVPSRVFCPHDKLPCVGGTQPSSGCVRVSGGVREVEGGMVAALLRCLGLRGRVKRTITPEADCHPSYGRRVFLLLIDSGRGHSLTLSLHIKALLREGWLPLGIYNII